MALANDILFLNDLLRVLNAYVSKNQKKIEKNESGRKDDVNRIAQLIYNYANMNTVPVTDILNASDKSLPLISQPSTQQYEKTFVEFANNLIEMLKKIKTGLAFSELKSKIKSVIKKQLHGVRNSFLSPIESLPEEVLWDIFSYLSPSENAAISRANRFFYRLANDDNLWKAQVQTKYPKAETLIGKNPSESYKGFFKRIPHSTTFIAWYTPYFSTYSWRNPLEFLNLKYKEKPTPFNCALMFGSLDLIKKQLQLDLDKLKNSREVIIVEVDRNIEETKRLIKAKDHEKIWTHTRSIQSCSPSLNFSKLLTIEYTENRGFAKAEAPSKFIFLYSIASLT